MNPDAMIQDIISDPSTPYWAKDVIKVAMEKDACDAYFTLDLLAKAFKQRCDRLMGAR